MNPELIEQDETESITRRPRDPELQSLERIIRIIEDMEPATQKRALAYLSARYPGAAS